jgi:broad specificity phosphatase PhoE
MRIVLVRHGKPDGVRTGAISGLDIGQWVRRYNEVGITRELPPPARARELASSARCMIASDLPRARESAAWLAASKDVRVDRELREAGLPESLHISVRLSPGAWVVLARVAWWLNLCQSEETIAMTRQRAGRVADRLGVLAAAHGSVLAIGHGMFNRFVARQLLRRGWRGPKPLPSGYWAVAQFDRRDVETVGGRR